MASTTGTCGGGVKFTIIIVHMYDNIINLENIYNAWNEFQKGKKYKNDVAEFARYLDIHLYNLYIELKSKTYSHGTYTHFKINDPKQRDIHKASVKDRIVHHLLYGVLYPYFDSKFIYDSYSCRINKGTHKAIKRFEHFHRKVSKNGTMQCYVLKCDIRKFFASIDHDILKTILAKHIEDKDILHILFNIIDSFPNGLPLGNLTSQILVNIYMNEFDQYIKHTLKIKYYIRYADDFVILSQDKNYLENMKIEISNFLNQKLKLQLHPNKVFIKTIYSGIDFLGFVHFPHHRVLRTVTKRRMWSKLKKNNYKLESVNSYVGMLGFGNEIKTVNKIKSHMV